MSDDEGLGAATAGPFDQLLAADARAGNRSRQPRPKLARQQGETKLSSILGYLREVGSAQSTTLCSLVEVSSQQLWGLMKAPREHGQVTYVEGRWSINESYD